MKLNPETSDLQAYLQTSAVIDWQHPDILDLAQSLAKGQSSELDIAKNCFAWVRDRIKHSWDFQLNPVTCNASEVLRQQTGYCYAKAHLLAALLRANHIPAGFCYQRLSLEENGDIYCLHGLNAVYLQDFGWYRVDPRGNNKNVQAKFCPPKEQLAFKIVGKLEQDFAEIKVEPLTVVIEALNNNHTFLDLYHHLPDAISLEIDY